MQKNTALCYNSVRLYRTKKGSYIMNENELDLKNLFPPNWKEEFDKSVKEAIEYVNSHPEEELEISSGKMEENMKDAIKNNQIVYGSPEALAYMESLRKKMIENGEI